MPFGTEFDLLEFEVSIPVLILSSVLTVYSVVKLRKLMNERLTFYFVGFFAIGTAYYACKVFGLLFAVAPVYMFGRLISAFTCVALLTLFALNLSRTRGKYAIPAKIGVAAWWVLAEVSGFYYGYQVIPGWPLVWNTEALFAAALTPLIALIISASMLMSGRKSTKLFHKVRARLIGIPLSLWIIAESVSTLLVQGGQFYILGLSPEFWVFLGIFEVPFVAIPSLVVFYVGFSMPVWLQVRLGIMPKTAK
ncbi:MAG: hypothetical protein WED04_10855 [Promethearchaeati archaeon SRVP18_Atabeyarchaeia-1]